MTAPNAPVRLTADIAKDLYWEPCRPWSDSPSLNRYAKNAIDALAEGRTICIDAALLRRLVESHGLVTDRLEQFTQKTTPDNLFGLGGAGPMLHALIVALAEQSHAI